MPGTTAVLAPAVATTGFKRLYAERDGVTINTAPYDAVVATPTVLETSLPDGTVEMKGSQGIDIVFCGTDTDNDDFNFEIWYYYLVADPTAPEDEYMWLPKLVGSSATGANANQLGTFAGVDGKYIENELTFADTIGAITNSAHQTHLELFNTVTSNIEVESPASNGVAMVSIRNVAGAHAVRVHPYEDDTAGNAITMQVLVRLTRGLNP